MTATTDLEKLQAAMEAAEAEYVRVRDEEPQLKAAYQAAGLQGDAKAMMEIQRQLDEHPVRAKVARVAFLRAAVDYYDAAMKAADTDRRAHQPAVQEAVQVFEEARRRLIEARRQYSRLDGRYEQMRELRNQTRRELEDLVGELSKPKGRLLRFEAW